MLKKIIKRFITKFRTINYCGILPNHISIEITNHCNYKCKMCPSTHQKFNRGVMSFPTVVSITKKINEISGVDYITIGGMGEPTLDENLSEKITYIKENLSRKTPIQLHTNGSSTQKILCKLLPVVDIFSLSLNAAFSDTHKKITGVDSFNHVLNNLNYLINNKQTYKYKIRLTMVKSKFIKKAESKAFNVKFSNLVDYIEIHNEKNWGNWKPLNIKHQYPCKPIWQTLSLNWDGTVRLCTEDYNREYILGDINKDSIEKIFNSPKILEARQNHHNGSFGKSTGICTNCSKTMGDPFWYKTPIRYISNAPLSEIIVIIYDNLSKLMKKNTLLTPP